MKRRFALLLVVVGVLAWPTGAQAEHGGGPDVPCPALTCPI
jgi:hypothetical protein